VGTFDGTLSLTDSILHSVGADDGERVAVFSFTADAKVGGAVKAAVGAIVRSASVINSVGVAVGIEVIARCM